MPKNHAFEEKSSKRTKVLNFIKNYKFLRSSRNIIQLKMENNVRQSNIDQPLWTNPYRNELKLRIAEK